MTRRKPSKSDFKNFWSVYEAKQAQKTKTIQSSDNAKTQEQK